MRLDIVRTVFLKELREMLRDRRSLAVMFGLPLLLYPLAAIGISSLETSRRRELTDQIARVVLTDPAAAPRLDQMFQAKDSGIQLVPLSASEDERAQLAQGKIDAVVTDAPGVEQRALRGGKIDLNVALDRSRTSAEFVERKIRKVIEDYQRWIIEQRLKERGVPASVLTPVTMSTDDVANSAQRFGRQIGVALPMLLMMTGMLGALFPALNATTTERELGTLEALLLTPARRFELLTAKGLLVLICALLTAGLNMLSMSAVLIHAIRMAGGATQSLSISPGMLALSYLAAVPAMIFFTAIVMMVGLVARNFREANSFATPVMLIPLASMAVAMMEPKATPALLITPVANTTIVIREVLTGRATVGEFLLAFISSCFVAGILLSLAGRLFSSEQLVNPSWEPVSLKMFRRGSGRPRVRLPAVDEALVLFGLVLLLLFYVSPLFLKRGLLAAAVGNELLLILAPALLFAAVARWDFVRTFQLRRSPAAWLIAAALLGIGLAPWAQLASVWQNRFWPTDPETTKIETDLFVAALKAHPILTVIIVGLLAGVCEEILFRGPIQTAMIRRIPPAAAIGFTAALFSAAHLDVHGFVIRAILGAVLGTLVWRSASIIPAMLAHCLFDSTQLAFSAWQIHQESLGHTIDETHLTSSDAILLAGGAILIAGAIAILRLRERSADPATASAASVPL